VRRDVAFEVERPLILAGLVDEASSSLAATTCQWRSMSASVFGPGGQ
jgi:hypothetical protein